MKNMSWVIYIGCALAPICFAETSCDQTLCPAILRKNLKLFTAVYFYIFCGAIGINLVPEESYSK